MPPVTGQGQWALGFREPLNPNERVKKDDDGLNVRARIESIYQYRGFDSIDPQDLRGRMRWWGLYTQRKQGIGGGLTGSLEPEDIEDPYFMLRVRIDGGRLTSEQLRVIAGIATEFGRDVADVTDRQNVQLHWIRIEDVPEIWRRLEAVGLSTTTACGDTPRVFLGCPLAGEHANDVAFVGVIGPDGTPGFDLWVGGGLSTNPKLATRLGAFVTEEQVPDVWVGVTSIFRDYGYRRSRNRARLKFLMADWGPEKFREVLEKEYLGFQLPDGPPPPPPVNKRRDHVGITAGKDGTFAVGFAPRAGRVSGTLLSKVADLAEQFGDGRVRTTVEQKLVIPAVSDPDGLTAALAEHDLIVKASAFRRGTMACTGLEFCKLAIVETKARAMELVEELERRLPDFDEPIGINVNGCPNACARFQVADIGLKGMLIGGEDGFQVHLGGSMGREAALGRKVRGLKVTAAELPDYVERMLRLYQDERSDGESFASWVRRADEAQLK
jgi:sulfite reductase (ferredoxin)